MRCTKLLLRTIIVALGLLLWFNSPLFAQKEDSYWAFSDSIALYFEDSICTAGASKAFYSGNAASIASPEGQPLFYTRTGSLIDPMNDTTNSIDYVFYTLSIGSLIDHNGMLVENGDSVRIAGSGLNSVVILPFYGEQQDYYYICATITQKFDFYNPIQVPTYHLLVRDKATNTLKVVQKNVPFDTHLTTQPLTAVRHANGVDWWVIYHKRNTDIFVIWLLTRNGFVERYEQKIGSLHYRYEDNMIKPTWGEFVFDRTGKYMAVISPYYFYQNPNNYVRYNKLELLEFNRCTGIFKQSWVLDSTNIENGTNVNNPVFWDYLAFSPNGSRLYAVNTYSPPAIYQYDLSHLAIYNKNQDRRLIHKLNQTSGYYDIQLAPDSKLYIATAQWQHPDSKWRSLLTEHSSYLSIIHSPDSLGAACNFQRKGLYLNGKACGINLPNMPNYRLGALTEPVDMGLSWEASSAGGLSVAFVGSDPCATCGVLWQFGDGATSTATSPLHTYPDAGSYVVRYIVSSLYGGCADTLEKVVHVSQGGVITGLSGLPTTASFSVYPNPAGDVVRVACATTTRYQLALYSAVGREVYRAQSTAPTQDIDVSTLPEGVYLLQVFTENRSFTKKITIRR